MEIVDAHVHFWSLESGLYPQFENPPRHGMMGDCGGLAHDHRIRDLRSEARDVELRGAIAIEAEARDAQQEVEWLEAEAEAGDLPLALVVHVDLAAADARAQLEARLAASKRVRGVRQILNVHDNPTHDYVGRHFMREPRWREHFGLLAQYDLSFDLQLYPHQMFDAVALAREHPDTSFILNHAGMWADRNLKGWRAWRDGMHALAACPNVTTKLSGLAMLDTRWAVESFRPLILEAIDAFGIERCLFASNFPVDRLASDYTTLMNAWQTIVSDCSDAEQQALFADNARRLYRLETS